MQGSGIRVDRDGIHFHDPFSGSADVYFGEHRGWSFSVDKPGALFVRWPKRMHAFLDGWSVVRVVAGDEELFEGRIVFSDADREVEMRDRHGLPVIIDKWGLLQRPFDSRMDGLLGLLADESQRILDILQDTCGVPAWISFGTLLGAARNGKAIGHDSDVDLCYLSEKKTPAEAQRELWAIGRALRAADMRVLIRSGSFLTVQVPTPDGAGAGIDVYTTFFLDGLFYETATVRAPVPRSAVLPITPIEFEGRMLPGPADPAKLLEISYGPNWRVPDPSFQHQPGREIEDRFDQWFGKLWRQRREWAAFNKASAAEAPRPSTFAALVAEQLTPGTRVVDLGAGVGADAHYLAEQGFDVVALDYALPGPRRWPSHERLDRGYVNLYDGRDVLSRGAMLARHPGPQAVYARHLLESLAPDGRDQFWRLVPLALRRGGELHVESQAWARPAIARRREQLGGRFWAVSPRDMVEAAKAAGGVVRRAEGIAEAERSVASTVAVPPTTWTMTISWPARGGAARSIPADDRTESSA
jgi:hypothetical protein